MDVQVHAVPARGMQQIHRDYGLWVIRGSAGNATPPDSFPDCPRRYFQYYSISHMYEGAGRLWTETGKEQEIAPGQCVVICPNTVNRYGGINGQRYVEDSVCFLGPVADMLQRSGVVRNGVFELGYARLLLPIGQLAADPAINAQINACIALQKLLVDIYNQNTQRGVNRADFAVDQLLATLKEQVNRWWTVREMADFCNLGTAQFRRLFLKRTGMLPKIYIDRLKVQKAGEMLLTDRYRITEITERLGYVDQYHFSRRFKKLTGLSPRSYRQTFPRHV